MTAEIAIMNKEAIALAADSAVTMANQKTIPSANKLFSLSKYYPVGVMIYQNAEIMSIPWETIIKIYREKLNKTHFDYLEDYVDHFINFLNSENPLFPEEVQEQYMYDDVKGYFGFLKNLIMKEIELELSKNKEIDHGKIEKISKDIIRSQSKIWDDAERVPSFPENFEDIIINKYGNTLDGIINKEFENLINPRHFNKLKRMAASLIFKFPKDMQKNNYSGIVIAGFGDKDIFPKLKSLHLEGIFNNSLKYKEMKHVEVTRSGMGAIIPFAQQEMVVRFMEGVDPNYILTEKGYLSEVFYNYAETVVNLVENYNKHDKQKLKNRLLKMGKEIQQDHQKKLDNLRKKEFVDPILEVVANLPKGDLALMAESLVNLTSFKRKWSMERETVGGPIDVAVISKGDKFVWIKRKHYFESDLNHQFFKNYYE